MTMAPAGQCKHIGARRLGLRDHDHDHDQQLKFEFSVRGRQLQAQLHPSDRFLSINQRSRARGADGGPMQ